MFDQHGVEVIFEIRSGQGNSTNPAAIGPPISRHLPANENAAGWQDGIVLRRTETCTGHGVGVVSSGGSALVHADG